MFPPTHLVIPDGNTKVEHLPVPSQSQRGIATNRVPGITTRNKDATSNKGPRYERSKDATNGALAPRADCSSPSDGFRPTVARWGATGATMRCPSRTARLNRTTRFGRLKQTERGRSRSNKDELTTFFADPTHCVPQCCPVDTSFDIFGLVSKRIYGIRPTNRRCFFPAMALGSR